MRKLLAMEKETNFWSCFFLQALMSVLNEKIFIFVLLKSQPTRTETIYYCVRLPSIVFYEQ